MSRLIDGDALYKDICDSINQMTAIGIAVDGDWMWAKLNDALDNAPTIEERKKGKWILVREADENGNALYECSVCHMGETHVPIVEVSYCWNCGADMRGEGNG